MSRTEQIISPYSRTRLPLYMGPPPSDNRITVQVSVNPRVHHTSTRIITSTSQSQTKAISRNLKNRAGFTKHSVYKTKQIFLAIPSVLIFRLLNQVCQKIKTLDLTKNLLFSILP